MTVINETRGGLITPSYPTVNYITNSRLSVISRGVLAEIGTRVSSDTWTGTDCTLTTVSADQGAEYMVYTRSITRTGGDVQYKTSNPFAVVSGMLHRLSLYVKDSNARTYSVTLTNAAGDVTYDTTFGVPTANFTTFTLSVIPTEDTMVIKIGRHSSAADAGTMEFKDVRLYRVEPIISSGTYGADGHTKTSTLIVQRYVNDATRLNTLYGLKLTKGSNDTEYYSLTNRTDQEWLKMFQGKDVSLGCHVYAEQADNARLEIADGVAGITGSMAPATTLSWLNLSYGVAANATVLQPRIALTGNTGDVTYISNPILIPGRGIAEGRIFPPPGEIIMLDAALFDNRHGPSGFGGQDVSSVDWNTINLESDCQGKIPKGVRSILLAVAAKDSGSAAAECYLAFRRDSTTDLDLIVSPGGLPNSLKSYASGWLRVDPDDLTCQYKVVASGSATFNKGEWRILGVMY